MRPGVRYRETRNSDGTANFHSVPLMGTLKPGSRGNTKGVGREWMQAALDAARADADRGYLAPLKPTHADGVPYVCGYVLPTHIADEQYDDGAMPTLFGDFIAVEPSTAEKLRRGEWPFRSVEIVDWSAPRVNAVALLAADAPHFRFPLFAGTLLDDAMPGRFCAAKLAAFGDDSDKGDAPAESPAHEKAEAGALERIESMLSRVVAGLASLLKGDKAEQVDESLEAVAQPVEDVPPDAGDESETKDAPAEAAAEKGEEPKPEGDEMPTDEKKGDKMSADTSAKLAAMTASVADLTTKLAAVTTERDSLSAKLAAEEAKTKAAETAAACAKAIAEARAKLRAKRRILPADFDLRAAKFYAAGTFDEFVATAETCFASDPEEHFGGGAMIAATGDADIDAAVAKFASGKPAGTYELAAEAAEKFRAMKRNAPKSSVTIDEFLRVNVRPTSAK